MPVRSNVTAFLSAGGGQLPCITATVTKTSKRKGDTFNCKLPLDIPGALQLAEGGAAEVIFSDGSGTRSLIIGNIDHVSIEWIDREVCVSGRDKSSVLSEKKLNKQYKNKKTSDIVEDIAQQAGLQAQVQSTKDDAGKKYDVDTVHLLLNKTPFEALSRLAEREGCRWYVDDSTLHFEPKDQGNSGGLFTVNYSGPESGYERSNALYIRTSRNMSAARPCDVTVKSWHHKQKKLFEHTESSEGGVGDKLTYEHHFPGMIQEQVEKIAKSFLSDYKRHELSVEVDMPGDLSIDAKGQLQLQGTGSIFDTIYDIDSIEFEYAAGEHGSFGMSICGKTPGAEGGAS